MMDNAAGSPAPSWCLVIEQGTLHRGFVCMHWNGISKAYTPSVLKESGLKCFRDAPPVPFYLAHYCFLKAVLVRFDGDGILHGNSALCS